MIASAKEIRAAYPHTKQGNAQFKRDLRRGKGVARRMTVEQVARREEYAHRKRVETRNASKSGPVKVYFDPSIIKAP
jgi:hypothetical protein